MVMDSGSTGYGKAFRRGDRHDWGGGDYSEYSQQLP